MVMPPLKSLKALADAVPKVAPTPAPPPAAIERIMTRAQWEVARKKAGGKQGMVKGVNLGQLLDNWHKAMSRETSFTIASRSADKQTYALVLGLNKYKADQVVKKTPALRETVEKQLLAVDGHVKRAHSAHKTAVTLDEEFKTLLTKARSKPVNFSDVETQMKKVGTALRNLSYSDPSINNIATWWNSSVAARKSMGGVASSPTDDVNYRTEAAQALADLVVAVRGELVKHRIIAA
jgi:hypothetical protein